MRSSDALHADADLPVADLAFAALLPRPDGLPDPIAEAVALGGIRLAYQPILDAASSRVVAVEALVRCFDAQRGAISPAEFVAEAERGHAIHAFGDWVLDTACAQLAEWDQRAGGTGCGLRMSVNVAARQFTRAGFVTGVAGALGLHGLSPARLEVEITERSPIDGAAAEGASALRALGVRVSLDDFGTGLCSLEWLQRVEADAIKIDRTFVHRLPAMSRDAALVRALVGLARELRIDAVAEGVETPEQRAFLVAIGCSHLQGWLFAPALAPEALADYLGLPA